MSQRLADTLARLLGLPPSKNVAMDASSPANPVDDARAQPTGIRNPDGSLSKYPPPERWSDWTEYDSKAWPAKVARTYDLVPTICFNCESGCGLLAYVDKDGHQIRKFEGNPAHPGSRGRNCAKGPATHNQIHDPERILYPLKRVGERGEGKWKRVSWDEALDDISAKMRASRQKRRDGIMYHVGRPGEDHYANRCIQAWGVDGHNSHTNVCSASSRLGYYLWAGFDRPSPDYANARCILLISSHLETGHYFNPHAQRIMEAKKAGAKLLVMDPRLSNTATKADVWMPTWPGSETTVLLAIANHLLTTDQWNREFVRDWVDWQGFLRNLPRIQPDMVATPATFETFESALKAIYADFTFERAAKESEVPIERIREAADAVAWCGNQLAAHNWRAASIGNRGGWQVVRALFLLNVLTGSVGTKGGTSGNSWNKFVPKPFSQPPPGTVWNELQLPDEWPLAHFEMSFLLPHLMEEGRGTVDVYFTRVYNPLWTNPDGFMWHRALRDHDKFGVHIALTPTWNETAWFADYVLPMGHAGERHDLMSQETHSGKWIGFRQPVRRVAMERAGKKVQFTHEANPGEVWEEAEFWVELSGRMDPDGSLGIRKWFESPYRPGELITQDEYWGWMFDNSVPGLPEAAAKEGLTPLAYMRKYGCFEVSTDNYEPYKASGFKTPSGKLELLSETLLDWGWDTLDHAVPWPLDSHVSQKNIDRSAGQMLLLPNWRLPTLVHTRSANAKWLYEISHANPVWLHPSDAKRMGVVTGDLLRIDTENGWFVDRVWATEGIKPGVLAISHHLGRWRLTEAQGVNRGASNLAKIDESGSTSTLHVKHGAAAFESADPDTARIWWKTVGVHQNLAHPVHPDPVSGAHCWLQKATSVRKARADEKYGEVHVDLERSMAVYREWKALTKPASTHSPDRTRRPYWLKRPLKPIREAYNLPSDDD
jgi:anaerobic selenocysteine-containing dehydrogenase